MCNTLGCPYQPYFGECNNPTGNSKKLNAWCCKNVECSQCSDVVDAESVDDDGLCEDCVKEQREEEGLDVDELDFEMED